MNGTPLGFTTSLGRDWKQWMAFRELASNCLDEGGSYFEGDAEPEDGCTVIAVTGAAFRKAWQIRDTVIIDTRPITSNRYIEVHEGNSPYVYYRGVRVHQMNKPSAMTYNILEAIELTEDRTAKNAWQVGIQIERGIGLIEDSSILRRFLTAGPDRYEHTLDVHQYGSPREAFRSIAAELALGSEALPNLNQNAKNHARRDALALMRPEDGAQLTSVQKRMMDKAINMLRAAGYDVKRFEIIICDTLGAGICGLAKDGKIYLSLLPFQKGTREVAATLLEEYAHLVSGADDCTREFQNWLFDQVLIGVEKESGEPF